MLTNVKLILCGENRPKFDAMSQMMTQLLPSITSIESLRPYDCYDHNAALFQEELSDMLASTRILRHWSGLIPLKKLATESTDMENCLPKPADWHYINLPKQNNLSPFKLLSIIYSFQSFWLWLR
jgi:hypothetical protein